MTGWLSDTLVWTGALIALVLVLRRPVARQFGARMAYALWALPFVRLILPPIELPAALGPQAEPMAVAYTLNTEPVPTSAQQAAQALPFDWAGLLLAVWLAGAVLFLVRRFGLYARMRQEMLRDAVPMGRAGQVRLVETPLAPSPVAFGVFDKIVALPPGFMASPDRATRDMALAHELAHHRGRDLLVNFAVQPLFALHWFNPLGWLGWDALRRDQEAACDERVVAGFTRPQRAAYATLITGLVAGPNIALAAPMSCPVLGEKSIIQRLRSLTMTDISPRRRMLGRALLAGSLLAVPLTASTTYAAQDSAEAPGEAAAPQTVKREKIVILQRGDGDAPDDAALHTRTIEKDGRTIVFKSTEPLSDEEIERRVAEAEAGRAMADALAQDHDAERRIVIRKREAMSKDEREQMQAELEAELRNMDRDLAEARKEQRFAMIEMRRAQGDAITRVRVDCSDKPGGEWQGKDGQRHVVLCKSDVTASALAGLREAREDVAGDADLSAEIKAEVLKALDEEIAKLSRSDEG